METRTSSDFYFPCIVFICIQNEALKSLFCQKGITECAHSGINPSFLKIREKGIEAQIGISSFPTPTGQVLLNICSSSYGFAPNHCDEKTSLPFNPFSNFLPRKRRVAHNDTTRPVDGMGLPDNLMKSVPRNAVRLLHNFDSTLWHNHLNTSEPSVFPGPQFSDDTLGILAHSRLKSGLTQSRIGIELNQNRLPVLLDGYIPADNIEEW